MTRKKAGRNNLTDSVITQPKKIEEFLGKDYKVMSSYGHIRDLKKKELSINEKTMEPDTRQINTGHD